MKPEEMLLQTTMLNKLHESGCPVNIEISLWRPDRKWVDYVFSLNDFIFRENPPDICTFKSEMSTDSFSTVEITLFCKPEDADYLSKKIKQRKEVNK